jgi:hypothetical protein
LKVTELAAASIFLSASSIAALSAAPSLTTGEPPEKSIVLPSWMGTAAGGSRCDAYIQSAAAAAAAPASVDRMRVLFNEGIVGHRRGGGNKTCR